MSAQHQDLAAGRWNKMSLVEQMANIGSEVERALSWQAKDNLVYSQKAQDRALELIDLSLDGVKGFTRLKELARLREALVDYFCGVNQYGSTDISWKKYFSCFTYAARRNY